MSYVKNTWNSGDVVTAAKLNNIENGIEKAIETPTGGTAGQYLKKTASGSEWADVPGGAEKFVVTFTAEDYESDIATSNRTVKQIYEAYEQGKQVVGKLIIDDKDAGSIFNLTTCKFSADDYTITFSCVDADFGETIFASKVSEDTTGFDMYYYADVEELPEMGSETVNKFVKCVYDENHECYKTVWADAGSGGSDKVFIVNFSEGSEENKYVSDKTLKQITDAYAEGKIIEGRAGAVFHLESCSTGSVYRVNFQRIDGPIQGALIARGNATDNVFTLNDYTMNVLPEMDEDTVGKVAKCAYDEETEEYYTEWADAQGGESNFFIVTVTGDAHTPTSEDWTPITVDKTINEIYAAIYSGKIVMLQDNLINLSQNSYYLRCTANLSWANGDSYPQTTFIGLTIDLYSSEIGAYTLLYDIHSSSARVKIVNAQPINNLSLL